MPTLAALKRARRELRARLNQFAQQDSPDLAVCGALCREIESLLYSFWLQRSAGRKFTFGLQRVSDRVWQIANCYLLPSALIFPVL